MVDAVVYINTQLMSKKTETVQESNAYLQAGQFTDIQERNETTTK